MVWVQGEACGARAVRSAGEAGGGGSGGGECEGSGGGDNGKEGWGRGREQWVGSGGRGQAGEGLQADVTGVGGGTEWEAPRWDGIVEESRMRDGGRGGERAWGGRCWDAGVPGEEDGGLGCDAA